MTTWIKRWQAEIAATKLPGVWRMRSGGCLVRARASERATARVVEIRKRLPELDEAAAFAWLEAERRRIREGASSGQRQRQRFAEFASSLMERKLILREIKSARGREKWKHTLTHLMSGTGPVAGFGEMFIDRITPAHVEAWRVGIASLISAGTYKPSTANGWLGILKVITKAARKELQLPIDAAEDAKFFDTSEHVTYSEEQPNSLTAAEAHRFLAVMRSDFPQHYAMTCLGFATGLRPSSLRPLRRSGATPDILWTQHVILVRRSHTLDSVMETTKTGLRQRISVPPELLDVLKWHVDTQLLTAEQQDSDLLFPAEGGRPRSESCLKKPFAIVAKLLGLKKTITPKAMRRTFNDLTRHARVDGIVTRSISGHLTEEMHEHYQTVSPDEQRKAVGAVLRLVQGGDAGGVGKRRSGDAGRRRRVKTA